MSEMSFDELGCEEDEQEFEPGYAEVMKVIKDKKIFTVWFKMENEKVVRERYHLGWKDDMDKLKRVIQVLLGDDIKTFDVDDLVGQRCYVELEERPWIEGKSWIGVSEVFVEDPTK